MTIDFRLGPLSGMLVAGASAMIIALGRNADPEAFDRAEDRFLEVSRQLEANPTAAVSVIGELAVQLVVHALESAEAGDWGLMEGITDSSLTGDPSANHFVSLARQVVTSSEAEMRSAFEVLDGSIQNLARSPEAAGQAAKALAIRVAMARVPSAPNL